MGGRRVIVPGIWDEGVLNPRLTFQCEGFESFAEEAVMALRGTSMTLRFVCRIYVYSSLYGF